MKSLLLLLPILASCAARRLPEPGVAIQVEDLPGRRVVSVDVEHGEGIWAVSGVLHGYRLDTPDRRTVRIEILDASGRSQSSYEGVARAHVSKPWIHTVDRARFRVEVPDPGSIATLRLRVAGD